MYRVQFCGLKVLIVELFLQNFCFIQRMSTNNFRNNCIIVNSVKGVVSFDYIYGPEFK